jgi:acyl-CoA synthetase (AMP-forming)/AMP-acid ligase II
VDRLNDRIIKAFFNYPSEVESILDGTPDVKDSPVVPVPDETMGGIKACWY